MLFLRSLAFYVGYVGVTVVWGGFWTIFGLFLPFRTRFRVIINWWSRLVLLWLRSTCNVRYTVEGLDNIPERACVVFARHESTWETLFLQSLFVPQATVIKRSLLHIPFFGWPFRLLRPIAIDRDKPREALRAISEVGQSRLDDNIWVVLFPEGTRCQVGALGKFGPGGAYLCQASGAPCLVVAHNAGRFWPPHQFVKHPGEISVKISEPLDTNGQKAKEINRLAMNRMRDLYRHLESGLATTRPD